MKNRCNLLGITVIATVTIFVSLACQNPVNQPSEQPATGSITGEAKFTNSANHSGITITLEQSDGLRSVAAVNANRSIVEGVSNARALSMGARSVTAATQTAADGSYTLRDIPAGTYTLYASSRDSLEKAVTKNITVRANNVFDAGTLNLTPVGSISGKITVDSSGAMGFLVSVAGTSFMAVTGSDGAFTISGIPAGSGYYLIVMKGNYTILYTEAAQSVSGGGTTELTAINIAGEDMNADSIIRIGEDGYWYINGVKTNVRAQGADGKDGENGAAGSAGPQGPQGNTGPEGPNGNPGNMIIERVSFTGLTANGDVNNTTTRLTLSFSIDLTGLSPNDITIIDSGNTGAVVGPLTRTGEGVYNLIVYGVNAPGLINVVVSKNTYIVNPVYKSVSLYYNANSTPSFTNINDMAAWLQAAPSNSNSAPYQITLSGLNLESDLMYNTDPLRKLFDALNGKYVALDLRGCTGGSLTDLASSAIADSRPNRNYYLIAIQLPDSITYIGDYMFYMLGNYLTSVTLPASLTSIGDNAFSGCSGLTSITLPASLTSIGESAFSGCRSLVFTVNGSGQLWTSDDGIMLMWNTTVVSAPGANGSVTIPDGITSIRDYAFSSCSSLTSITLPASVTSIGDNAFYYCSGLTSVTLPASLTSIGNDAFSGCSSLTSITLPASLTSIGNYAFFSCSSLLLVTCNAVSPPTTMSYNVFYSSHSNLAIKVPSGSVAAYKAASGWSSYADRISAIGE